MKYNKKEYNDKEYWKDGSNGYCDSCGGCVEEPRNSHCERCNEEYENHCNEACKNAPKTCQPTTW